jgi:hypothetical protein
MTLRWVYSQSKYFSIRGQSYFSRLPKYWPPIPLFARRVCPPPATLAGRRGGWGVKKTREIGLPSYSKICTLWVYFKEKNSFSLSFYGSARSCRLSSIFWVFDHSLFFWYGSWSYFSVGLGSVSGSVSCFWSYMDFFTNILEINFLCIPVLKVCWIACYDEI